MIIPARERSVTIDFWRGVVLLTIFVNHVPGNPLEAVTHRNFGFSDGAEAFVFIAGVSVAMVYGPRMMAEPLAVVLRCVRRAWELYRAHLQLSLAALAIFGAAYLVTGHSGFATEHGRDLVARDGFLALAGILTLGHQLGYFNILPLYVVLLLMAPAVLVVAAASPVRALALSLTLYLAARLGGLNLPTWPEPGQWFFNPFAWQLLFTIGVVTGLGFRDRGVPFVPLLYRAALLYLAVAAVVTSDGLGFAPGLLDAARERLDFFKNDLASLRLIHVLALAYVLSQSALGTRAATTRVGSELARLGRHGLAIFVAGSVLSASGQVLLTLFELNGWAGGAVAGLLFVAFGTTVLVAVARVLDTRRERSRRPSGRKVPETPVAAVTQRSSTRATLAPAAPAGPKGRPSYGGPRG